MGDRAKRLPLTDDLYPVPTWQHLPRWEITPARVWWWLNKGGFEQLRERCAALYALGPHGPDELGLFLTDLDCYEGWWCRWKLGCAPEPPDPLTYLRAGREDWGLLAVLMREAAEGIEAGEGGADA